MEYHDSPRPDAFTQGCRDLIRTFTYEDILACTWYAPPMVFMLGPAAIVAGDPSITVFLHALPGFALSSMLHRMGHRLLMALPKGPHRIHLTRSLCLPWKLTLSQLLWTLEAIVGAAVFCGILAKRYFLAGGNGGVMTGLGFFVLGLALYFVPIYLGRLWIERYYPAVSLVGPTEDVITQSFPARRSLLRYFPFI